jgi:hypothetical protein
MEYNNAKIVFFLDYSTAVSQIGYSSPMSLTGDPNFDSAVEEKVNK